MKPRLSLWQKIWRKVRAEKPPADRVVKLAAERPPKRASSLEPLEGRIAPAALINPTTLIYKDIDGDIVTVKFSKAIFNATTPSTDLAALANAVFKFDTGNVVGSGFTSFDPATAVAQQLQLIDLTKAPVTAKAGNLASGTSVAITAAQGSLPGQDGAVPGDGFGNIGYVKATNLTLGKVAIDGDLGQIDVGNVNVKTAISALQVQSLGVKGLTTQATTGASLESNFVGALGSLTVLGDLKDAVVRVSNGVDFANRITAPGFIGSITIGGSLIGAAADADASDSTGLIDCAGGIGAIKIGTNATQGIVGGGGKFSGSIFSRGDVASLTVSGNVAGGLDLNAGSVLVSGKIGKVLIGGNLDGGAGEGTAVISGASGLTSVVVQGSVLGDAGKNSGLIEGFTVGTVTITGDVVAGTGERSGLISSVLDMGAVKIGGDIDATTPNAGLTSGGITAGVDSGGKLASLVVSGALKGGSGVNSGFVMSGGDMGAVTVQSIVGGSAVNAGSIVAGGKLAALTVLTDLTGGTASGAGSIFTGFDPFRVGDLGAVKIGGKLQGGSATGSGTIDARGKIASVTIGPAKAATPTTVLLAGGGGDFSGSIFSRGGLGAVKIMGHVEGGAGDFSGAIFSRDLLDADRAGDLGAVSIAGHLLGGAGDDSGQIRADGKLASASVGELQGGDGARSGGLRSGQGIVGVGDTGAIAIKGALIGGLGAQSGGIVSEGKIAGVTISGNTAGGTIRAGDNLAAATFKANVTDTVVSARGQAVQGGAADLAIGKITVEGNVSGARFLAGYDTALAGVNTDAQIGAVVVKGGWAASDLVAGVTDGGEAGFGTSGDALIGGFDNAKIVSSIASIVIGGAVSGSAAEGDHFGFTAQKIGAFKAGAIAQPLNKLADGQVIELAGGDVTIREITAPVPPAALPA